MDDVTRPQTAGPFSFFCSLLVKCVVVFSIVKGTGDILSKKGGNVRI